VAPGADDLWTGTRPPPRVAVVGAFDRFNYGDLLFAAVMERMLRGAADPARVDFYALVRRDLRHLGGPRTRPLKELFRPGELPDGSVVIVAGGEVLDAGWGHTLETAGSAPLVFLLRRVNQYLGCRAADRLSRWLAGTPLEEPWVLAPSDFPSRVRVAYNAVGGASLDRLPAEVRARVEEKLAQATYLSVRDERTRELLEAGQLAGRARLAPDSVVLLASLYPPASLEERAVPPVRELVRQHAGGYLCFQINKNLGSGQGRLLAAQLEAIYRCHGLAAVLLPIGRARFHEDQVPLAEVRQHLRTPAVLAAGELTTHDITYLIASARAYAGTSLHGAITALAYGVPSLGLTPSVPKQAAFFRTWGIPGRCGVALEEIAAQLPAVLAVPRPDLERKGAELVAAARDNFRALFEAVGIAAGQGAVPLPAP
jgi:polysaccharide pyruvyl transferase WcaK-like protein